MKTKILPNTNILIYYLVGIEPFKTLFSQWLKEDRLVFSPIVISEFLIKASKEDRQKVAKMWDICPVIPIDLETAFIAAEIRRTSLKNKQKLHLPDCLIAAQCLLNGFQLATENKADFSRTGITLVKF